MLEHVRQRIVLGNMAGLGQQVDDDLGVGRALEDVPVGFVLRAQQGGVDQVAVVGDRHRTQVEAAQQRLGVAQLAGAGGGIAHVTDGGLARPALRAASAA